MILFIILFYALKVLFASRITIKNKTQRITYEKLSACFLRYQSIDSGFLDFSLLLSDFCFDTRIASFLSLARSK